MHEDLLGYLLGALEPHEMRRVARLIQENPSARKQLEQIQRALEPLEGNLQSMAELPPSDLVSKTMANLPPLPPSQTEADATLGQRSRADSQSQATFDSLIPMHPEIEFTKATNWSWLDWAGGAAAAAAVLGLLIPALAEGRFEARKAACQAQLRQFGTAFTQFVNRDLQHRLPAVAEAGPEAFAGVYAIRLGDAGLLPDASLRWCPSQATPRPAKVTLTPIETVSSLDDLYQASADMLRQIQQFAGGHYAYTLGVIDQHRLRPPRFESRSSFAVMSDAPPAGFAGRNDLDRLTGHGGEGINVLFEDGRVEFIRLPALNSMPDHPLLNNRGQTEAGVNIDDASLAPSWVAPFINAIQR